MLIGYQYVNITGAWRNPNLWNYCFMTKIWIHTYIHLIKNTDTRKCIQIKWNKLSDNSKLKYTEICRNTCRIKYDFQNCWKDGYILKVRYCIIYKKCTVHKPNMVNNSSTSACSKFPQTIFNCAIWISNLVYAKHINVKERFIMLTKKIEVGGNQRDNWIRWQLTRREEQCNWIMNLHLTTSHELLQSLNGCPSHTDQKVI